MHYLIEVIEPPVQQLVSDVHFRILYFTLLVQKLSYLFTSLVHPRTHGSLDQNLKKRHGIKGFSFSLLIDVLHCFNLCD
jgi:hypothetical protein